MTRPSLPLRALALAAVLLPLAGCGVLPKREPIALYRPEAVVATDPAWPQANWQLRIARPYADDAHDSARILVRPQPGELQVYKGAAWTQPAPDLVLDTLLRAFDDSGRVAGVGRRGEGVGADYELLLDLRRFEADAPADGTAVAAVDRAFAQGLGTVTTQLIGWTLDEGRKDAATKR